MPQCLHPLMALALLIGAAHVAQADVTVPIEASGGSIAIPETWRPIPRAEVQEFLERSRGASAKGAQPVDISAAFQALPTLQWFALPYVLLRWEPGVHALPDLPRDGVQHARSQADLVLLGRAGQHGRRTIWSWSGAVRRAQGVYRIEGFSANESDEELVLAMLQSLKDGSARP